MRDLMMSHHDKMENFIKQLHKYIEEDAFWQSTHTLKKFKEQWKPMTVVTHCVCDKHVKRNQVLNTIASQWGADVMQTLYSQITAEDYNELFTVWSLTLKVPTSEEYVT